MPTALQLRSRLMEKLKELFQLDQPDLDFGFYRIMHMKAEEISTFLNEDLLQIIEDEFKESSKAKSKSEAELAREALITALGEGALNEDGTVKEAFEALPAAKAYTEAMEKAGAHMASLSDEGQIFDHLYRFFERYYDGGDFLSRRYYTRETAGQAAPYAIPYNGEEVKLHWANADQYYIKSAEHFSNYSFDLIKGSEVNSEDKRKRGLTEEADMFEGLGELPAKLCVHFQIAEAAEGEHGNIKASDDENRFFFLRKSSPIEFDAQGELLIKFEYRPAHDDDALNVDRRADLRKYHLKADKTPYSTNVTEGELPPLDIADCVLAALRGSDAPNAATYRSLLTQPAPTDKINIRPLLAKYIKQYTARNSMDYFIHKDLGTFLKRELDFYIKNEIMRLDDLTSDSVQAPAVEDYLAKVRVLRKIAQKLITFLAQLEEFQKKLWLKKKFVTETNYCITLDRIPEEFHKEVASNRAQHDEWVKLFAIDEIVATEGDLIAPGEVGFTEPLSVEFIKENPYLVLDTAHFDEGFCNRLMSSIHSMDEETNGLLINSENLHALKLIQKRYDQQIKCIYIDPPYNTGGDGFAYKDAYQHASWLTMISERLSAAYPILADNGVLFSSIDENERSSLECALNEVFDKKNRVEEIIWVQNTTKNQSPTYSTNHEYIPVYAKNINTVTSDHATFRESKPGYIEIMELIDELNPKYPSIQEFEDALKQLYKEHKNQVKKDAEETGEEVNDEWKGIYNYKHFDYRDSEGNYVEASVAKAKKARIWVWREADTSMPQIKKDSQKPEFRDEQSPTFRFYKPIHPITGKPCPHPKTGWVWPMLPHGRQKSSFDQLAKDRRIAWGEDENKIPQRKCFIHEVETNVAKSVVNDYTDGEKELTRLFGQSRTFGGPKPTTLIQRLCDQAALGDGLFCDFFAGSGTSGQSVLQYNREKELSASYLLVESGAHFYDILIPRIKKVIYASDWNAGKPTSRDSGVSNCFKYIRLESYEDCLNNLTFNEEAEMEETFKEQYYLNYLLDHQTAGSPSLLNIERFDDPTAYKMMFKKPGSDVSKEQAVDLIETFNYLIGLRVETLSAPQSFSAKFVRPEDPDVPEGQLTKLQLNGRLKKDVEGAFWFRAITGWVPKNSSIPDKETREEKPQNKERVLIIWRKLTGDLEKDNVVLDEFFQRSGLSSLDSEFDTIYVNGSNNLPNLKVETDRWRVVLLEEAFHKQMWDSQDV
jgi:adenine-specific DNA-methyltransferase